MISKIKELCKSKGHAPFGAGLAVAQTVWTGVRCVPVANVSGRTGVKVSTPTQDPDPLDLYGLFQAHA